MDSKTPKNSKIESELLKFQTFGDLLKFECGEKLVAELCSQPEFLPKDFDKEKFRGECLRFFEPWPDWVLKIKAQIVSVYFPTIKKSEIHEFIYFIHQLIFEIKLDGSTPNEKIKFPKIEKSVAGKVIGHILGFDDPAKGLLAQSAALKSEKSDNLIRLEQEITVFRNEFNKLILDYLSAKPEGITDILSETGNAQAKTFDKNGQLKETTATKIYQIIYENWPGIEKMSGVTELTRFLEPHLGVGDFEAKADRVKKICRRMDITFKAGV